MPCSRLQVHCEPDQTVISVQVMAASSHKQRVQRAFVRIALTTAQHGFTALDRSLVYFSALMTDAYDVWYDSWAKAVQVTVPCCWLIGLTTSLLSWLPWLPVACIWARPNASHPTHAENQLLNAGWAPGLQGDELAKQLAADDQAGTLPRQLYNHYTIITKGKGGQDKYSQVAYASYFPQEIGGILAVFDQWLAGTGLPSRWLSTWQHPRCGHAAKHLLRQCGHLWLHAHAVAVGAARDPPACPACPTLLCRTRRQVPATVSHPC